MKTIMRTDKATYAKLSDRSSSIISHYVMLPLDPGASDRVECHQHTRRFYIGRKLYNRIMTGERIETPRYIYNGAGL